MLIPKLQMKDMRSWLKCWLQSTLWQLPSCKLQANKPKRRKKKDVLQGAYEANFIHGLRNSTAMKVTGDNYSWSTFMATYTTATTTAIAAATPVNVC
jgi:hypothetical protein